MGLRKIDNKQVFCTVIPSSKQRDWLGYLTIVWSVMYGGMHLYWLLVGNGYPFKYDSNMGLFSPMISHLPIQVGGIIFVVLCLLGVLIGMAMHQTWGRSVPRWLVLAYAWGMAIALFLLVTNAHLIMMIAYMFLLKFAFTWLIFNQIICIIGALLWGFAAIAYQRKTRNACEACGRTEERKPFLLVRWGRWMTYIAVLAPLPYALTRFAWALDIPLGVSAKFLDDFVKINPSSHITEWVFGSLCVGGGILTLGLIQKWGEVFPKWFPFIGGKRVPVLFAVIPALCIAIAVTAAGFIFTFAFIASIFVPLPNDNLISGQAWGTIGPMLFWIPWGMALGLATIAYYYRRRGRCDHCGRDGV